LRKAKPATSISIWLTVSSDRNFAAGTEFRIIVSARARAMRLRVDRRTGEVLLTVPKRASRRQALEWAATHRAWVERQLAAIEPRVKLLPGTRLSLFGEPHEIVWNESRPRVPAAEAGRILIGGSPETLEVRLSRWLRREARRLLSIESAEFAAKAGVRIVRISVGDPCSRWGSCSASGAIRYSWRLILAPSFVRRATVAHEVAHLVHMNHGAEFHFLVARLLGEDAKPARLWLRRNGATLHRIGPA
jgi:predicted metal-dependent hydrolase